jgi:hypothetical protein
MKKVVFILFLLTAGLIASTESNAQQAPVEIRNVPPAVEATWHQVMVNVYYNQFNRYGITTWYMDKGTFISKTVFRVSSYFVTVTLYISPQGELLQAETDL